MARTEVVQPEFGHYHVAHLAPPCDASLCGSGGRPTGGSLDVLFDGLVCVDYGQFYVQFYAQTQDHVSTPPKSRS